MVTKKNEEFDASKHARYLADPDTGKATLVHADDLEAKQADGWKDAEGMQANGLPWNQDEDEEAVAQRDAAAESAKLNAEYKSKKDEKKAKELADQQAANDKARADEPEHADMTVRVVDDKPAKAKK